MIDWTKPLRTTHIPPRPVHVLRNIEGDAVAFQIEGSGLLFCCCDDEGWVYEPVKGEVFRLRNVAPKPVRQEAWVNLYGNGIATLQSSRTNADKVADHQERVECRHIVWNSDGSPVESDDLTEAEVELEIAKAERDMWKAKT